MAKFHKADEEFQVNSDFIGVEVDPGMHPTGWEGDFNVRCFSKSDSIFIKGDKYVYKCTGETIVYDGDTFWQFIAIDEGTLVWFVANDAQTPSDLQMVVGDDLYYLQIVEGEVVSDRVQEQISVVDMQENIGEGVFITSTQVWMRDGEDEVVGTIEQTGQNGVPGIYKFSVNGNLVGVFDNTEDVNFKADITGEPEYDPENPNFVYWPVPEHTLIPAEIFDGDVYLSDVVDTLMTLYRTENLYPAIGTPFYLGTVPVFGPKFCRVSQIYEKENSIDCTVEYSVTRERWAEIQHQVEYYCFDFSVPRYMFIRFSQDVWITEE